MALSKRVARDQMLQVRCSSEERERWRAKAEASGVSVSTLLRRTLDGVAVRRRRRAAVDPALTRELARIGNNLNQLARWANRDKGGVPAVAVVARLVEFERELIALREQVEASSSGDASSPSRSEDAPC